MARFGSLTLFVVLACGCSRYGFDSIDGDGGPSAPTSTGGDGAVAGGDGGPSGDDTGAGGDITPLLEAPTKLSVGVGHVCDVVTGVVRCWGDVPSYSTPDGHGAGAVPVVMTSLPAGSATHVASGWGHVCVVIDGAVWCWGSDYQGRLGNGPGDGSGWYPVLGLTAGATRVAAGSDAKSCAIVDGALWCWGRNNNGELGVGHTTTEVQSPELIVGLPAGTVEHVEASSGHVCAIVDGALYCWGDGNEGELGDGTATFRDAPVLVPGFEANVTDVNLDSDHTCAIRSGEVYCWGANYDGRVGDGSQTERPSPVELSTIPPRAVQVATMDEASCALLDDGAAYCWGRNDYGQLGDGTRLQRLSPVPVQNLAAGSGAIEISAGGSQACVLKSSGEIWCWGSNHYGQLGNEIPRYYNTPQAALSVSGMTSVTAGASSYTTCARGPALLSCWGHSHYQQTGTTGRFDFSTPAAPTFIAATIDEIALGNHHSCARTGGNLECWGVGWVGQIGGGQIGYVLDTPVLESTISPNVVSVNVADDHSCAIVDVTGAFGVHCWGTNNAGQLGNDALGAMSDPVAIPGLTTGVTHLASGAEHHVCAVMANDIWCWGDNMRGQLGNGTMNDETGPVQVASQPVGTVNGIAVGGDHTCALIDSDVYCWGAEPAIGPLAVDDSADPLLVLGGAGATKVVAGRFNVCALAGGAVRCWGDGYNGQNGDGTWLHTATPTTVIGLSGVTDIDCGYEHCCAVVGGAVHCWGDNITGSLGNGDPVSSTTPIVVPATQ